MSRIPIQKSNKGRLVRNPYPNLYNSDEETTLLPYSIVELVSLAKVVLNRGTEVQDDMWSVKPVTGTKWDPKKFYAAVGHYAISPLSWGFGHVDFPAFVRVTGDYAAGTVVGVLGDHKLHLDVPGFEVIGAGLNGPLPDDDFVLLVQEVRTPPLMVKLTSPVNPGGSGTSIIQRYNLNTNEYEDGEDLTVFEDLGISAPIPANRRARVLWDIWRKEYMITSVGCVEV